MSNGIESTSSFVGKRLWRFAWVAVIANLLLCLMFLVAVTRANSAQICTVVGVNIQSYIEPLSREIVIGNKEHLATILETIKSSNLLKDISLSEITTPFSHPQKEQCSLNGMKIEFMTPVTFGQRQVGVLKGNILWIPIAQIAAIIGVTVLLSLFFMWISTRFLLRDLHKALITPIGKLARGEVLNGGMLTSDVLKIKHDLDVSRENAQYAAVGQLTQMLAHDVRKPFSMIQIVLQNVAVTKSLHEVKNIIRSSSQEINRALTTVNSMLADIMEIGRDTISSREWISPKSLISTSLLEVCRLFPGQTIFFSTSFDHGYLLEIDAAKVQRVISNIIENAMQAMQEQGRGQGDLWFSSEAPDSDGFVKLVIGNSNSHIDSIDAQRLFEAFFTKGKKGGTGLGLAIAKKIVTAHGGQIGCTVVNEKGVEFWFTLPASTQKDEVSITMPKSTVEVYESMSATAANDDELSEEAQCNLVETAIAQKLQGRRIKIMILDDEKIYRSALIRLLQNLGEVSPFIDLLVASSSNEALELAISKPDIGLFDYDLGDTSLNGIETLKAMRQRVPGISVCIHSNHISRTQEAVDAGAHYFLPKPISKMHLLRIINESLDVINQSIMPSSDGVVALLDDCHFNRTAWMRMNSGRPLMTFESPDMFWKHVEKQPDFFNSLAFIVTDHFFDSSSAITGIEFAQTVSGKPVFLASVGDFSNEHPIQGIAGILPKKVMEWDELHEFCASHSTDLKEKKFARINNEDDFQISLKIKFIASAGDIVDEIEIAVEKKNEQQVDDLVHKLQGAASIVGAHSVVDACRVMQSRQLSEKDCLIQLRNSVALMEQDIKNLKISRVSHDA